MAQKVKEKAAEEQKTGAKAKIKLKEDRINLVREEILKAKDNIEGGYLDLSRLLSEAYHKEFYLVWGFETFEEYCKNELDVAYRKAMYLVEIWDKVKALNIPKERLHKLGWTKMKDLASVIDEKNYQSWLKKAEKMTTRELTDAVKVTRKPDKKAPATTTLKVVMSAAETQSIMDAIEEAKKLTEQEATSIALELICADWMADKGALPEKTPLETMVKYVEKTYNVDIKTTPRKGKPAAAKEHAAKKAEEVIKKAEKKGKERKAKKGGADLEDLGEGEAGVDINDLLGVSK